MFLHSRKTASESAAIDGAAASVREGLPPRTLHRLESPRRFVAPARFSLLVLHDGAASWSEFGTSFAEKGETCGAATSFTARDLHEFRTRDVEGVEEAWHSVLRSIATGIFDGVLVAPAASTCSRAAYSNRRGPTPIRSRDFPHGFPWLKGALVKDLFGG